MSAQVQVYCVNIIFHQSSSITKKYAKLVMVWAFWYWILFLGFLNFYTSCFLTFSQSQLQACWPTVCLVLVSSCFGKNAGIKFFENCPSASNHISKFFQGPGMPLICNWTRFRLAFKTIYSLNWPSIIILHFLVWRSFFDK